MAVTIKLRQGVKTDLTNLVTGMTQGEPLYATDSQELYLANSSTDKFPVLIDLEALTSITADGAVGGADLLYIYAMGKSGIKARKVSFNDFKTALNIPDAATDEKVAIADGQTAGFLGTNGNDGVLRVSDLTPGDRTSGLAMTDNSGVTYLSLALNGQQGGDIIMRNTANTGWTRLPKGAFGQFIGIATIGGNPTWLDTLDGGTF